MRLRPPAVLVGALFVGSALVAGDGCQGASSPTPSARLIARGTVETLESAWLAAAQVCVNVAQSEDGGAVGTTLNDCEQVLTPARDAIILGGQLVDTWSTADQTQFNCLMGQVVQELTEAQALVVSIAGPLPQPFSDALQLASSFTPLCTADAGGQ